MKESFLVWLVFLFVATANLPGCIIWPWWEDEGERSHHGEYHDRHHGDHHYEGAYGERR